MEIVPKGDNREKSITLPQNISSLDAPEQSMILMEYARSGKDGDKESFFRNFTITLVGDHRKASGLSDATAELRDNVSVDDVNRVFLESYKMTTLWNKDTWLYVLHQASEEGFNINMLISHMFMVLPGIAEIEAEVNDASIEEPLEEYYKNKILSNPDFVRKNQDALVGYSHGVIKKDDIKKVLGGLLSRIFNKKTKNKSEALGFQQEKQRLPKE